jgi:hypothetical protein
MADTPEPAFTIDRPTESTAGKSSPSSLPAHHTGRPIKTKRNRRILACQLCREKKAKCDRVQPACRRCRNGRLACHYASSPFRDEILDNQLFGLSYPLGFGNVFPKHDSAYDILPHTPESSVFIPIETPALASNAQTTGFDSATTYRESRPSSGRQFELSPHLSYQTQMSHFELSPVVAATQKPSDAVLYRSGAPKLHFHGSSAAISVIYSTPVILKEVSGVCRTTFDSSCSWYGIIKY